jgi:hypothetical protein
MEYLICILPIAIVLWLIICDIIDDRRTDRRYQEYIDSIKVGDIFVPNFIEDLDNDPFDENDYSSEYSKIIIDIKKNKKGETWVKSKYLKYEDSETTEEIHRFVKNWTRIKQSEI